MGAKRALIVDDSKSARAFLSRILEQYDIEVETAESAEEAIAMLGTSRPDVIFMDHLMPGMDGFQAVQSIKNNPRTAMIPIMMYTSQEGELYLGQARALGAIGVLPKQIKPADVSKVLYQLRLLPDRRSGDQTTFEPATTQEVKALAGAAVADPDETARNGGIAHLGPEIKSLVDGAVHTQMGELRQFITASLEEHSGRLADNVRAAVKEATPPTPPMPDLAPPRPSPVSWIAAAAAAIAALVLGVFWWQANTRSALLESRVATLETERDQAKAALAASERAASEAAQSFGAMGGAADVAGFGVDGAQPGDLASPAEQVGNDGESPATARPAVASGGTTNGAAISEAVPYGEPPLSGPRLESVRSMLARLATQNFRGGVEIRTIPGRFCLEGNANDGYSLAPDDTPLSKCAIVGNPFDESLTSTQREPLDFANLVAGYRQSTGGGVDVRVTAADAASVVVPYPANTEKTTAGEWNRAGSANNRIEIRLRSVR